ncbi:MAG: UbiA family prenyltransferase [Bacteroidia bacterium]|nr:UbiA family prenyltransferase [Bacteroidia bacterium]MCX7653021.1 UbiA family prenyltransferase [Bacteroidia bacterium]MDW8416159.1 UbiA family prenyltransferase [Bacteroidia bacterium]
MGTASPHRTHSARVSPLRRTLRRLEALGRLARPTNLILIVATSLSAQLLIWKEVKDFTPAWTEWSLMVLSTVLIAAGGYWLNDLYDQPIDRINRPNRALWAARAGQRALFSTTLIAWMTGILLGVFLPLEIAFIHLGAMVALGWYARFGKRTGLLGNTLIAILTGVVPWEVILLSERTTYSVAWMVPMAIGFNFVRELVKDAEDLRGDQTYGVRSLPGKLSYKAWQTLLKSLWIALIGLALLPALVYFILWNKLPLMYLAATLPTVILPLLWGIMEWNNYSFMSLMLKASMAGGIIALWSL